MLEKRNKLIFFVLLISFYSCSDCNKIDLVSCGPEESPLVDFVVIMDQSSSMREKARNISDAADRAIEEAKRDCGKDVRVEYLAINTVAFPSTLFTTTVKDYLSPLVPGGTSFTIDAYAYLDTIATLTLPHLEIGAAAITDVANYYDWRQGACKSIFYVSDEPVNGGFAVPIEIETMAVNDAISAGIRNEVVFFMNTIQGEAFGMPIFNELNIANIDRLCLETKGRNYLTNEVDIETYLNIMPEIICNSCAVCPLNDFTN